MKTLKKSLTALFLLTALFAFAVNAKAETRAYQYLHSVKDGIKFKDSYDGMIWYFTFSPDKSKVYMTDKNGYALTQGAYASYQGTNNGILIYKETIPFLGVSYYYFSSDLSRLNWDCAPDNLNNKGEKIIRVLNYVPNPGTASAPTQLY